MRPGDLLIFTATVGMILFVLGTILYNTFVKLKSKYGRQLVEVHVNFMTPNGDILFRREVIALVPKKKVSSIKDLWASFDPLEARLNKIANLTVLGIAYRIKELGGKIDKITSWSMPKGYEQPGSLIPYFPTEDL